MQQRLAECGAGIHQVLAIVHQHQHVPVGQGGLQMGLGIDAFGHREAHFRGQGSGQLRGLGERCQVGKTHTIGEITELLLGDAQRHGGLADPTGADQGDMPARVQTPCEVFDQLVAALDAHRPARQVGQSAGRQRHLAPGLADLLDMGDEAVAALAHVGDVVPRLRAHAEHPAQRGDVYAQVDLFDEGSWPDAGDDRLLADDLAGAFHQHQQDVQGPGANRQRPLAIEQQATLGVQLEAAEAQDGIAAIGLEIVHDLFSIPPCRTSPIGSRLLGALPLLF